jgi:hypothetical protein
MTKFKYFGLFLVLSLTFFLFSCSETIDSESSEEWLIPENEVQDGGPGKDGIPAISSPEFIPISGVDFLFDDDLVIGIQIGDTIRAYPHRILDQHEIVNELIDSTYFALTYCPLTGSAIAWDSTGFTGDHTFGVSGLLYNSNLIPYDRQTDSNWSQMKSLCVNGELKGQEPILLHVIETTWGTWKELYPNSLILSDDTGFNKDYSVYPYGNYKWDDSLLFSVSNEDDRLPKKDRVHGIIVSEETRVYPLNHFTDSIQAINETFNGAELVIVGSALKNFAEAFSRELQNGTLLTFSAVDGELPVVMIDNEGTKWDIFGNAVSGPRVGEKLTPARSFTAYWFAWAAFYPGAEIYSQ